MVKISVEFNHKKEYKKSKIFLENKTIYHIFAV